MATARYGFGAPTAAVCRGATGNARIGGGFRCRSGKTAPCSFCSACCGARKTTTRLSCDAARPRCFGVTTKGGGWRGRGGGLTSAASRSARKATGLSFRQARFGRTPLYTRSSCSFPYSCCFGRRRRTAQNGSRCRSSFSSREWGTGTTLPL